jgi:hypothetical protein
VDSLLDLREKKRGKRASQGNNYYGFSIFNYFINLLNFFSAWKVPPVDGSNSIWDNICRHKLPVVEPRGADQFGMAINDFYTKIEDEENSGAIFFSVCRGKVSEGLDFANKNGRAVVITGIPFPSLTDAKVNF